MICNRIISSVWVERIKSKLIDSADPDLNTVIRLYKNDEHTRNRTQYRKV